MGNFSCFFVWEQHKLGDCLTVNSGKDYKSLNRGNIPVYGTGGYMLSVDKTLSKKDAIGIGRKGTIDHPQLLKAPFWTVDTLFWNVPKNSYDIYFLYSVFQKIEWKKYDESTGLPSLSKTTINNIKVNTTSYNEQNKIGQIIKLIDHAKFLQQRKLKKIKLLKRAMLQNLFTCKSFPKVRFKGFLNAWEQRKLGDLCTFSKGKGYTKKNLVNNGTPIFLYGELYTHYSEKVSNACFYSKLSPNSVLSKGTEVVLPDSGETPADIARASWIANPGIILGGGLIIINLNRYLFPGFLAYSLTYGKSHKLLVSKAQGKSVVHIHTYDLRMLNIIYPKDLKEQYDLFKILEKLNKCIDLQQQKVKELQQTKEFLLQNMFI